MDELCDQRENPCAGSWMSHYVAWRTRLSLQTGELKSRCDVRSGSALLRRKRWQATARSRRAWLKHSFALAESWTHIACQKRAFWGSDENYALFYQECFLSVWLNKSGTWDIVREAASIFALGSATSPRVSIYREWREEKHYEFELSTWAVYSTRCFRLLKSTEKTCNGMTQRAQWIENHSFDSIFPFESTTTNDGCWQTGDFHCMCKTRPHAFSCSKSPAFDKWWIMWV